FRLFQIVKLFRERGHHVTFVARAAAGEHDPTPYVEALAALGVDVIAVDPDRIRDKWGAEIDAPRLDLQRLLTARRWDVAYLYFYELAAQYLDAIRQWSPTTRVVVDSVDVHFLREIRRARLEGDPALARQAAVTREAELGVYRRADVVVTVTEADR